MVAVLIADLRARGVTLVADGERLRCRPRSALREEDLDVLKASKLEILSLLKDGQERPRVICYSCKGSRFWLSIHGVVICGACHPPASPRLVVRWIGAEASS